jgi:hypothetical protein
VAVAPAAVKATDDVCEESVAAVGCTLAVMAMNPLSGLLPSSKLAELPSLSRADTATLYT